MRRGRKCTAQYAVYRGEEFIDIGTASELAERFNVRQKMIYWHACCRRFKSGKHHNSSVVFYRVEEDDD